MADQFPSSWKNCATCAFWTGSRDTDTFGQRVTVSSSMSKGKCTNSSSGWKNSEKQANASCNCWQKWPVLE